MERNDENNDIIRKARQKAKQEKEEKEKLTEENLDDNELEIHNNMENTDEEKAKEPEGKIVMEEHNYEEDEGFNDKEYVNSKN